MPRVLVAGIGNVLRGDDGFGVAVVAALESRIADVAAHVRLVEIGIGGVGLITELMDGYDALVLLDAADRGEEPGTVYVLEPAVPDVAGLPPEQRRLMAADMHQLVPSRALVVAAALDVLPPAVRMIGCQPAETEELSTELSPPVAAAVPRAVDAVLSVVAELAAGLSHA